MYLSHGASVPSLSFGQIHCLVGGVHKCVKGAYGVGVDRRSDARADLNLAHFNCDGFAERGDDLVSCC